MSDFKIAHDFQEIEEGKHIELTLKDGSVLDSEEMNVLENSNLQEVYNASKHQQMRKLNRNAGIVHAYDEEEKEILSKYDDPFRDRESKGFVMSSDMREFKIPSVPNERKEDTQSLNVRKVVSSEYAKPARKRKRAIDMIEGDNESMQEAYKKRKLANLSSELLGTDENTELEQSLQRSIRLASRSTHSVSISDEVASSVSTQIEGEEYNDTTEFLSSVQPKASRDLERMANNPFTLKDAAGGATSVLNVSLPSERLRFESGLASMASQTNTSVNEIRSVIQNKPIQPAPQESVKEVEFVNKTYDLSRGIASCMQMLRDRGELDRKEYYGRAKDKAVEVGKDGVIIEYRDDKGRLMTQKQAFRYMNYQFHGQKKSKNKLEKELKREQAEKKKHNIDPTRGSAMFSMQKAIADKKQEPFVRIGFSK